MFVWRGQYTRCHKIFRGSFVIFKYFSEWCRSDMWQDITFLFTEKIPLLMKILFPEYYSYQVYYTAWIGSKRKLVFLSFSFPFSLILSIQLFMFWLRGYLSIGKNIQLLHLQPSKPCFFCFCASTEFYINKILYFVWLIPAFKP